MHTLQTIETDDQSFEAAGFVVDWLIAHGEDGRGERARYAPKGIIADASGKVVGVVAEIDDEEWRLLQ